MERIEDRRQENQNLTLYDDLGLAATATDGEIQEAYVNLVRLLHPDTQREKSLKRFAELQMKRASRAHAVLSDPERRRRYDAELAQGAAASPDSPVALRRTRARSRARTVITFGWLICAFAGAVGIGWYVSQQPGAPPAPAEVKAAPAQPSAAPAVPPPANPIAREEPAEANSNRDRAGDQAPTSSQQIELLENILLASPPKPVPGVKQFSGVWVLRAAEAAPAAASTPQSADLVLAEKQGTIQGRFRARYPTMGRPDPITVRFYFEGKRQDNVMNANWTGDGFTQGQIQLHLVSENTLELIWTATEAGKESWPSSGAALLVRKP